jgi:pyridoxal phosphate enzyme (YggS family)
MTEKSSTETERFEFIKNNIEDVRRRIAQAACKSGRRPEDITLVAVTKTMPASDAEAALECGIKVIGENKVQELLSKLPQLDMSGREAHIIGHLQTNKVKMIIDKADMIQSVDSIHLLGEIERQAARADRNMDVLIEVNIGEEASKTGVMPDKLGELLDAASGMEHIKVRGLMAIPPRCEEKELSRPYFAKMRRLFVDIGGKKTDNIDMRILSMGMSGDFDVAVEEGATMVRVGTAIFGHRNVPAKSDG